MAAPKITPEIEDLIVSLRTDEDGHRRSTRAIESELAKRGISLSYSSISLIFKRRQKEREEIAQEVTRERLVPLLTNDLDVLQELLDTEMLAFRATKPRPGPDGETKIPRDWVRLGGEVRELVVHRLRLSGAAPQGPLADFAEMNDEQLDAELAAVRRMLVVCGAAGQGPLPGLGDGDGEEGGA